MGRGETPKDVRSGREPRGFPFRARGAGDDQHQLSRPSARGKLCDARYEFVAAPAGDSLPPGCERAGAAETNHRGVRKVLWKLGCFAPAPMTHVRPMGASVHYAGTLPMSIEGGAQTCTKYGASRDVEGL